jgi:hypothetical protein
LLHRKRKISENIIVIIIKFKQLDLLRSVLIPAVVCAYRHVAADLINTHNTAEERSVSMHRREQAPNERIYDDGSTAVSF